MKAVREHETVLQTGTPAAQRCEASAGCELVRNGRIGKLKEAEVWLPAGLREGPFKSRAGPGGAELGLLAGPGADGGLREAALPHVFRYWYEYSGGTMTDWGAHHNDIAFWAIGLLGPGGGRGQGAGRDPFPAATPPYSEYDVKLHLCERRRPACAHDQADNIYRGVADPQGPAQWHSLRGEDGWIWVNRQPGQRPGAAHNAAAGDAQRVMSARTTWATSSTASARGSCRSATSRPAIAPRAFATWARLRCAPAWPSMGRGQRAVRRRARTGGKPVHRPRTAPAL